MKKYYHEGGLELGCEVTDLQTDESDEFQFYIYEIDDT